MKSEEELISLGLESLANIFTVDLAALRGQLEHGRAFVWETDPFARGGYSYPTPDCEEAIEEMIRPEGRKLYFAGEALNADIMATVESALQSGKEAAHRMMDVA